MKKSKIIEKELSYKIMGILFEIHNKLGGEYQEKYYQRAVAKALKREKIKYEEQLMVPLKFEDEKIGRYHLDFLIEDKIILEIKAVPSLRPIYFRQVRAYLKSKKLELGILANFKGKKLAYKRILFPIRINNSNKPNSDQFVLLAQQAIETFVRTGKNIKPPKGLPKEMTKKKAGVFVSIHTKNDQLRGCIGTFLPTKKNIAEEIISCAIAVTRDPRFPPVTEKELPDLIYKVDVLSALKPAEEQDLDPQKYGLLVTSSGGRRGLLLPDIPGIKTVKEQIEFCKLKAGISPDEPVDFQVFTVVRHSVQT